ncbi:hypothetical protein [Halalkalicoccus tibetensis]|uniref:Uncharacterized protein n=1 Tax=Halalkalicoccus tibetensis TaxID=175632 RepID=A0ABD5V694_9EURY
MSAWQNVVDDLAEKVSSSRKIEFSHLTPWQIWPFDSLAVSLGEKPRELFGNSLSKHQIRTGPDSHRQDGDSSRGAYETRGLSVDPSDFEELGVHLGTDMEYLNLKVTGRHNLPSWDNGG